MFNPYYQPELMELTTIGEIEFSDSSYQFDTRVFWQHAVTGAIYTARDSGCSCPTPFEDYHTLAELERVATLHQVEEFEREARDDLHGDSTTTGGEAESLLRRVRELVDWGRNA